MKKNIVLFTVLLIVPLSALCAEGMWTMNNLPKQHLQERYGFSPTSAWIDHVQRSAVRLAGGCSASFISSNGLVLTNHHCARDCVQQLSSAEKDYIRDGFLATTQKEELRCPEIELNRLDAISDVTERIKKATAGLDGEAYSKAQKAEKSRIEAACVGKNKEKTRCDVVELYHGGIYNLYQYHRFQDVRLAFAPEQAIAFFGGDPDNFNFPRYNLDMSLLRAYENGKPAKVKEYLKFSANGAKEGELTMTVGNPGSTQRQLTIAQLLRVRDVDLVPRLLLLSEIRGVLQQFSTLGAEQARISQDDLFGVENGFKALHGELNALLDPKVFAYKQQQENELRAYVESDPARKAKYGAAWDAIEKAQITYRNIESSYKFIERRRGFSSTYFSHARDLVRAAEERSKPNAERLREFTESQLPSLTQTLFSTAPIYPELEKVKLTWSLTKLREWLGVDNPIVKQVLGKESPATLAEKLISGTTLSDVAARKQLWDGGKTAIEQSTDPFIQLALKIDAASRAVRKEYEDNVETIENKNAELIAQAMFEKFGTNIYPDATFTMRLSDGIVSGWEEKSHKVSPFTDIAGAFDRHTGVDPFALPDSWLKTKDTLDKTQSFNFVTTNDIIGGNSGSPMINQKAELVGLVFDGNIHSLGGNFWYDESLNRTVAVHSGVILEALRHVYGAERLSKEIVEARK